jgi:hypothetical protein
VTKAPQDIVPGNPRKHPIENQEIGKLPPDRGERLVSIRCGLDPIALAGQLVCDEGRDIRFVLDDEDSGRR